ncbi:hypothetical protein BB561_004006 [Smittium simulii]|uniref:Arginase n=1 Tax=Smittium simulii TaxID=133385 RepID=A0A2T9YIK4_9FUNG|nr:hypothetical protein BB561_004006 [Smittium simulii]
MYTTISNKFIKAPFSVSLISAPFSGGQGKLGTEYGAEEMLKFGLANQIEQMGYVVNQLSIEAPENLKPLSEPESGNIKNIQWVSNVCKELSSKVEQECRARSLAITLGGDHSLGIGSLDGSSKAYGDDLCVLWVDAHADINTFDTTESGNIHGCPVAVAYRIEKSPIFNWVQNNLRKDRLAYIGLRDIDREEMKILKDLNIKVFTMYHIDKYGISKVFDMAMEYMNPNLDRPIHLSFDIDCLDPIYAPSTGTPVRGGMTSREGHFLCEAISETGCLVAIDLVEVNPRIGDTDSLSITVEMGCSLIRCAIGESLL